MQWTRSRRAAAPRARSRLLVLAALSLAASLRVSPRAADSRPVWRFVDVTAQSGLLVPEDGDETAGREPLERRVAGGVAAGDVDGDGLVDLYVVGGAGRNYLYRNRGDGRFDEVAREWGAARQGERTSGPLLFDYDRDGQLDLLVGAVDGSRGALLRNRGGRFEEVADGAGLALGGQTVSASAGDYDGDGWADVFLARWGAPAGACHLYRNLGGHFACADAEAGIAGAAPRTVDHTFSASFVDLDGDGQQDLLVAADFGESTLWRNRGGRFEPGRDGQITDENGMGTAVGDYDGDGDLDWFVSGIYDGDGVSEGDWGRSGNRLYQNDGAGHLHDATDAAGVRDGAWGWGAALADLDNDGALDLVVVNGWPQGSAQFRGTAARLFVGSARGRFAERAAELGFEERGGGRGVACLDYDGDGDLDLLVANHLGPHRLWRNDGGRAGGHFLDVDVKGAAQSDPALGARVSVSAGGRTWVKEVQAGSSYASQDAPRLHFGLGEAGRVERVSVRFPGGASAELEDVAADSVVVVRPGTTVAPCAPGCAPCR